MTIFKRRMPVDRMAVTLTELETLRAWSQARIDAGDMDFDDIVYRTRDAAATLLEIWGEPE